MKKGYNPRKPGLKTLRSLKTNHLPFFYPLNCESCAKGAIIIQQLQCDSGLVVSATATGATTTARVCRATTAAGDASTTCARVCRAATAGDAYTTSTGAPSTATRADAAAGIAPTVRAASTLSVGHDDGP